MSVLLERLDDVVDDAKLEESAPKVRIRREEALESVQIPGELTFAMPFVSDETLDDRSHGSPNFMGYLGGRLASPRAFLIPESGLL